MINSIEQLLIDNYDKYYRFAFSIVKHQDDALDVVQEAAYKAIKSKKSLKETRYADTWIHKIILNTAMDYLKKSGRELPQEEMQLMDERCASYERGYEKAELDNMLDCLEPEERALVVLKYFEEMKLENIAKVMGENVNTVKSRLYRTLNKLESIFGKESKNGK